MNSPEAAPVPSDVIHDVLVVGYGPTSQLLALMLGRAGHDVVVIERWPHLYPLPRAVHFDHEIARLLQAGGVMDDVARIVEPPDTYEWYNAAREALLVIESDRHALSGWRGAYTFSQPELERLLDAHIKRLPNVTVLQGACAIGIKQDAECVELTFQPGDVAGGEWKATGSPSTVRGCWLVGADGANSFVREAMDLPLRDLQFAFNWLVVDVQPSEHREWVPKNWQLCDPARPTTVVSGGPGRRRWEFMLLPGESMQEMNRVEVAWRLLEPWNIHAGNAKLERHAVYSFRARWAEQWQRGRVLLAGDAAHLMPPFAGQGMCSGMRDAGALAWRLGGILDGSLPEAILESYGPERIGHVREIIDFSVKLGHIICITDPPAAAARDTAMLAARAANSGAQSQAPLTPRLGPGLYDAAAPGSGLLAPQGRVRWEGRTGRFDDVVGRGFILLARDAIIAGQLEQRHAAALHHAGGRVVHFGPGGVDDLDGTYGAWLGGLGCQAALVRPDFYTYGAARDARAINDLFDHWQKSLSLSSGLHGNPTPVVD